jgi:hypothetical protein
VQFPWKYHVRAASSSLPSPLSAVILSEAKDLLFSPAGARK